MPGPPRTFPFVLAMAAALVVAPPAALADPANPDGSPNSLQGQLDEASRAYNDAKGRLDAAKQRQTDLTAQAASTKAQLDDLMPEANAVAVEAYKGGRLSGVAMLLDSGTPDDLLARATGLQMQLDRDNRTLRRLADAQARYTEQLAAIEVEVQMQQSQLAAMANGKNDLEKAIGGDGGKPFGGIGPIGAGSDSPAPRNPDGSWPKQSCSVNFQAEDGIRNLTVTGVQTCALPI